MSSTVPIAVGREAPTPQPTPGPPSRLVSLDVFRGATIAAMILVNNPGDERTTYWPLRHAQWNGWTPTDLIFPFFLFIVGVAMAYSFRARLKRGQSRARLLGHIVRRGLILFALGLFLNGFPNQFHLGSWRVYGVLERIAVCYMISAVLGLWTTRRVWIATVVGCLAGYWILMRYVPVPGFGIPTHTIPLLDPNRNLAAWLDRKLLAGHLYDGTRDPEGVLSTIPAVATSLLGLLTGDWLQSSHPLKSKAVRMALFGIAGVALGKVVDLWFPINKNLWTSSFVLFTAGMALVALALCYWIVDVSGHRGRVTKFFLVFGMNPIAAYVFAEAIAHWIDRMPGGADMTLEESLYQTLFASLASPSNASLLYAITYVLMCWVAMWLLYRKGIFFKI
ncbi:MAG TPA: heparan-alpha-glucosaminide N-acetyltransferase domain-containing protein [Terriglobales bacterium]|nr:heparan-alpha-glucosaminide N-acetyltransferase domain-containing protein [Terriglobales bacterium]